MSLPLPFFPIPAPPIHQESSKVILTGTRENRLTGPGRIHATGRDRLIQVDVAVTDFNVEPTIRIYANPCLVVHRGALSSIVGKGDQFSFVAFQACRNCLFVHVITPTIQVSRVYHPIFSANKVFLEQQLMVLAHLRKIHLSYLSGGEACKKEGADSPFPLRSRSRWQFQPGTTLAGAGCVIPGSPLICGIWRDASTCAGPWLRSALFAPW